jgi:uncharacterized membrane protein
MITTVTTSTTSTVSTIATAAGLGASLAFVAIVCLILFVMQKEVLSAPTGKGATALSRALNVAIVPLLLAFGMIVVARVFDIVK